MDNNIPKIMGTHNEAVLREEIIRIFAPDKIKKQLDLLREQKQELREVQYRMREIRGTIQDELYKHQQI